MPFNFNFVFFYASFNHYNKTTHSSQQLFFNELNISNHMIKLAVLA